MDLSLIGVLLDSCCCLLFLPMIVAGITLGIVYGVYKSKGKNLSTAKILITLAIPYVITLSIICLLLYFFVWINPNFYAM